MIKAKVLFMSVLVVAVVGGALAFKATTAGPAFNCGTTIDYCPNPDERRLTTVGATETNHYGGSYCTNSGTTNCTFVTIE